MGNKDMHADGDHQWWTKASNLRHLALATGYLALVIFLVVGCGTLEPSTPGAGTPEAPVSSPPSTDTPEAPMQSRVEVAMQGFQFQPAEVTIEAGGMVVWTNQDNVPHTVISGARDNPTGLFDETVDPGGEFSFTFEEPGTYEYHCSLHPGMDGTVVVE